MEIPNLEVLREISNNIGKEYDLERRLNRYKNLAPELIIFASQSGLQDSEEATRALFVADFIVTASEVPLGSVDDERYTSVIKAFIQGKLRCNSVDSLLQTFYLAYKIATLIRRQDLFMAGRGIDRKVALIRIKDCYITPYLQIASELLGSGSCGWELGILSAALTRNYPEKEIEKYIMAPSFSNHKSLTDPIWKMLENYALNQKVETNTNIIVPNVDTSQAILLFDINDPSQLSLWRVVPENVSKIRSDIQSIAQTFDRELTIQNKQLVFLRGSIVDSSNSLFILKDPYIDSKPLSVFISSVDEINTTRMLTILGLRGLEQDGWKSILSKPVPKKEKQIIKSTEIIPEIAEKAHEEPEKTSFLSKITSLFGKRGKKVPTGTKSIKTKEEKKREKKKKGLPTFLAQSEFLSQAITIDAVSDIDLYETFDTLREEPNGYSIVSIFETDFEGAQTTVLSTPQTDISSQLLSFVNSLDKITKSLNSAFGENIPFLLHEAFFINKDNDQKLIISLNGSLERVVGTIATSYFDTTADWQSREEIKEPLQRRSLHMRTSQLLSARRHTPFEEATTRIFSENFNMKNAKENIIKQRIPVLEQMYK
ncbi:MAG: hypothetical protein ACXAEX_21120 [Promethearchaeota archaeon]|jgi:hypothetical protein